MRVSDLTPPPGLRAVLYRFTAGHRRWFVAAFLMLVVEAFASVLRVYPIGYLIDFLEGKRPPLWFPWIASPQYRTIALLTTAIIVFAALDSLGDSLAEIFLARGGRSLGYAMRVMLYSHLQRLSLAFHNRQRTGDVVRRVTSDVDVANACLFLASDASRQITGIDLPVDGGWAML